MTTAILVAGLAMVVGLAAAATRPEWRIPALAFGLLAIPGNVDDLLPQMTLDPHPLAGAMAPALTFNDLLLVWALALTIRERHALTAWLRRFVILGTVLAVVASVSAAVAAVNGVELGAVIRGGILFARIPVYLYLAGALREELGDGSRLGFAIAAGAVFLLGNGVYTTFSDGDDRFTARTFGRNGLAVALTVAAVVASGVAFRHVEAMRGHGLRRVVTPICGVIAVACIFAMMQTGTRMALLLLLGAGVLALIAFPARLDRSRLRPIAVTGLILTATLAASSLTDAGTRTMSVMNPGSTVDAVGNLEDSAAAAEIRSRSAFWNAALTMARSNPVFGVGPFQMNIQRYVLDPSGPVVVADTHLAYLQIGAEFGLPTLLLYLSLLFSCLLTVAANLRTTAARAALGWAGLGIAIASVLFPMAALTNSHLFNPRNGPLEWLLLGSATALAIAVGERLGARSEDRDPQPQGASSAVLGDHAAASSESSGVR